MRAFVRFSPFAALCVMTACGGTEPVVEPPPAPAASLKVLVVTDTLRQMQSLQMVATASTAAGQPIAGAPITWSSLDDRVATIDASGMLLPRKPGTARIVARSGVATDTARVTVSMRWLDLVLSTGGGACGIGGDSTAYCWGSAELSGAATPPNRPTEVVGGRAFRSITVGGGTACGLTSAGDVYCWGKNENGELGNGPGPTSSTPLRVQSNGVVFTSIASEDGYTCGVATTSVVYCWGTNSYGQIGLTAVSSAAVPTIVPGLPRATMIATGYGTACALIVDGRVFCWGTDIWGQLGRGTMGGGGTAGSISSDLTFTNVTMSLSGGCAIATSGGAYCWGNHFGGPLTDATPTLVPSTTDFTSIVAGEWNRCGLTPSGAKCWGDNYSGQLGLGDAAPGLGPQLIPNTSNYVKLTLGWSAACGLTSAGAAYCWGFNVRGQLGDGTTETRKAPTHVLDPIT